jgi:uncharacterized protein with HEPN domain
MTVSAPTTSAGYKSHPGLIGNRLAPAVLRHEYDGADPEVIWRVIRSGDLSALKQAVIQALPRLRAGEERC